MAQAAKKSVVLVDRKTLTFKTEMDLLHLKRAVRTSDREMRDDGAPEPALMTITEDYTGVGEHKAPRSRFHQLVNVLAWYGPVAVCQLTTYTKKCHRNCAAAESDATECVCACGGLYHGEGIDADFELDEGGLLEHLPVRRIWYVRRNGTLDPDQPDEVHVGEKQLARRARTSPSLR